MDLAAVGGYGSFPPHKRVRFGDVAVPVLDVGSHMNPNIGFAELIVLLVIAMLLLLWLWGFR